ncbi:hypothetical protein [Pseudonocardia xishanensis]|uniref:Uncharacterized protein n=1 Tax=Pseudonocardia xishanensis TaxID=630995 RepID=A0ABP8S5T9_9PSEU
MTVFRLLLGVIAAAGVLIALMTAFPTEPFTSTLRSLGCSGVSYQVAEHRNGLVLAVSTTKCSELLTPERVARAVWTVSPYDVDFVSTTFWRGGHTVDVVLSAAELRASTGVDLASLPRPEKRVSAGSAIGETAARVVPVLALGAAGCALLACRRLIRGVIRAGIVLNVRR